MRVTSEIIKEVLVRANATTASTTSAGDALYHDELLGQWLDTSHRFCAGFKKWPFTEGRNSTTYVSGQEEYSYPEGFRSDSIRYIEVGGKRLQKTNFSDYKIFKEDRSSNTDKIFSDFGRLIFINTNAGVSGTLTTYGQYVPAVIDVTDNLATTVFTDADDEGNEAIVEEMLSYAMLREKKPDEAQMHHAKAVEILGALFERVKDEQFGYQTKDREMFKRLNVLDGGTRDEILKRDQWF